VGNVAQSAENHVFKPKIMGHISKKRWAKGGQSGLFCPIFTNFSQKSTKKSSKIFLIFHKN
jgi:hypothetical protein